MSRIRRVSPDGVQYRDLNGNGVMDPFEDPRRSPAERVADLLPRLSAEEKAGLLFHMITAVGEPGAHDVPGPFGPQTPRDLVTGLHLNHFNVGQLPPVRETVRWQNAMQELAEETPHGIPITFSSDPRHGFTENVGMALAADAVSQWPEPLGLAAIGDPELVQRFADIARREYLALGLRAALHPQVDLATEPRWARQAQTFGQDEATASAFVTAWLRGMQGEELGRTGSRAPPSTSPAAGRRPTARTRTSPTAGSRSTRVGGSTSTWHRSAPRSPPGPAG